MLKIFFQRFTAKQSISRWRSGRVLQLECRQLMSTEQHDHEERGLLDAMFPGVSSLGKSRDFITKLQQRIDFEPETMRNWLRKKKLSLLVEDQRFSTDRLEKLGHDLAAAHFICYRGGAVKFENNDRWFVRNEKQEIPHLPARRTPGIHVEAIDLSNVHIVYEGFQNFSSLKSLKYLNLSGCMFVDDWCISRLHVFKDSLLHLDISNCPRVTELGIATLHHLPNLKKLNLSNMPNVAYKQMVALQLEEELPDLFIDGVDFSREQTERELEESDKIIAKRREWQQAEEFDAGYLKDGLPGIDKLQTLLSKLPSSKGSWLGGWTEPKLKHKEVTEW